MVSDSARALAVRCESRTNALARRMSREFFESVPGYGTLPADVKDLEIAATVRHGVRLFLRGVISPPAAPDGYRLFRERAAQRAEEGVPLDLLLRTYAMGVYGLWQVMREEAGPDDGPALAELVDLLFQSQAEVVGAVTQHYLHQRDALESARRTDRTRLVRGLLHGVLDPDEARRAGLVLDGPLLLLAFHAGRVDAPDGPVAERRRQRRIRAALQSAFGADVPALTDGAPEEGGACGHAVVPRCGEVPDDLARLLEEGYGAPVRVAAAVATDAAGIPEAARTAGEIVRIARARGLPAGTVHRLDDVLLEFHLSRPGPSGERIAALLDPVADRPELLETLRTHLELCLDRRATASALGVHPNTVDKRLTRLTALTGLDLNSPHGTALALAAQLLREAPPH
ncbi:PucR family transcriptional regulator [Streptomyces sp. NPDC057939]|uniref:PucR family transcriptional regulator n=1 Tax=Streptomyces sp. NPDC057939 TaxID=3346284 RepID=UPI0036EDD129